MEKIIAIINENDTLNDMPLIETATILLELKEKGLLKFHVGVSAKNKGAI